MDGEGRRGGKVSLAHALAYMAYLALFQCSKVVARVGRLASLAYYGWCWRASKSAKDANIANYAKDATTGNPLPPRRRLTSTRLLRGQLPDPDEQGLSRLDTQPMLGAVERAL